MRSCFTTAGDCPAFAQSSEQNRDCPPSQAVAKQLRMTLTRNVWTALVAAALLQILPSKHASAATMDSAGALADAAALKMGNELGGPMDFDAPTDPLVGMAMSMYTKLAAGPMPLAVAVLSPSTDGLTIPLPFTPPGLGYLNSFLGAKVILGGKVPTAMPPTTPQSVFGYTEPDIAGGDPLTPKLEITYVPEPSAALLTTLAAMALRTTARRRTRVAAATSTRAI
jgi:hypothetical protein